MDTIDINGIILGPKEIRIVDKICKYLYGSDNITQKIAGLIGVSTDIRASKEFLETLTTQGMLTLIEEIFLDPKYKDLRSDNWNVYGDYVKNWPDELEEALLRKGISYDWKDKSFVYQGSRITPHLKIDSKDKYLPFVVSDLLYKDLIEETNNCYLHNLPTATFILSRKIIENLIIDIMRKKFSSANGQLMKYYDVSHKRFLDFSKLIDNLKNEENAFVGYESTIKNVVEISNKLRETANSSAHSIFSLNKLEDLKQYQIPDLVKTLFGLLERI